MRASLLAVPCCLFLIACGDDDDTSAQDDGGTVIGSTSVEIDTRVVTTHVGEAAVGSYMSDVFKDALADSGHPVDVAILNAGAIRGGEWDTENFAPKSADAAMGKLYPVGDLTDVDVAGWLPFRNDTVIMSVTGEQLRSVLERGVSSLPPDLAQEQGGWLLQVSDGLKYSVTCENQRQELNAEGAAIATPGSRVTKIEFKGTVIYDVAGSVDNLASATATVGVNSFIAGGFDGHVAFSAIPEADKTVIPFADLDHIAEVRKDIEASSPIAPATSGRITVIGACGVPATQP